MPAEINGKVPEHEYQPQDSGPLQQTRSTDQTSKSEMNFGNLDLAEFQYEPKDHANSECAVSTDETSKLILFPEQHDMLDDGGGDSGNDGDDRNKPRKRKKFLRFTDAIGRQYNFPFNRCQK